MLCISLNLLFYNVFYVFTHISVSFTRGNSFFPATGNRLHWGSQQWMCSPFKWSFWPLVQTKMFPFVLDFWRSTPGKGLPAGLWRSYRIRCRPEHCQGGLGLQLRHLGSGSCGASGGAGLSSCRGQTDHRYRHKPRQVWDWWVNYNLKQNIVPIFATIVLEIWSRKFTKSSQLFNWTQDTIIGHSKTFIGGFI